MAKTMTTPTALLYKLGMAAALTMVGGLAWGAAEKEVLPPGVEQLLPRGRIAAVFDPQFVTASEAKIPDEAWVLGVKVEGQAKAYSLNLLNRHEVVNDQSGDTEFAAVW